MKISFRLPLAALRRIFIVGVIVIVSGSAGYAFGQKNIGIKLGPVEINRAVPAGKQIDFSLFWQVWDELHRLYVDRQDLGSTKLIYGAISGMVNAAGDPYTIFLTPDQNKESKEDLSGSFGGVGIELGFKDHTLAVIAPLPDSPAEKAGVKAGDLILKVTDKSKQVDKATEGISLPEAVSFIRGPKGSEVTLTLARNGVDKPFAVNLVRDTIVVKTVDIHDKNEKCRLDKNSARAVSCLVPIIKVSRFGEKTDQEWDSAVEQVLSLKKENKTVPGIILDLRNDPGGFLDQAVNLASDFITSGPIVWQQTNDGQKTSYSVSRTARLADTRLVVLINEGSASAAEILAGALSERVDAVLVGEKSFGKGSVQQPEDLPGGSGLHVTIAKWLLPSQKSIDKVGITPTVTVQNDPNDQTSDKQLDKAIEILTNP